MDDAAEVTLRDASGSAVSATVIHLDPQRDIALLELDEPTEDWLRLATIVAGDQATVLVRNPDGSTSMTQAVVDRLVDVSIDGVGLRAGLEVDAALSPGRSGAPLVDVDGAMVGMAFAADRESPRAWAIATNEIEAALAQPTDGSISFSC
ncbi:MAG: trypsin-like peptidase domain-containing protein [Acidimicrobiales bacterium]